MTGFPQRRFKETRRVDKTSRQIRAVCRRLQWKVAGPSPYATTYAQVFCCDWTVASERWAAFADGLSSIL